MYKPVVADTRRDFLSRSSSLVMLGGLAAGYGTFAAMAGRFLFPAGPDGTAWVFVADLRSVEPGASLAFVTPGGAKVAIARRGNTGTADDFVALSSTCPHLGCQVSWEPQNTRFFCPCHNGVFNPEGKAIAGPPADAGQWLPRYPVRVENGVVFIEIPDAPLVAAGCRGTCGGDEGVG